MALSELQQLLQNNPKAGEILSDLAKSMPPSFPIRVKVETAAVELGQKPGEPK
jgi:hypothetical protein